MFDLFVNSIFVIFWKPEQCSWLINQKIILSFFRRFSTLGVNLQLSVIQTSFTLFYTIFKSINSVLLILNFNSQTDTYINMIDLFFGC
ncbi:unnamed protein product [Meloidogyne enterolobii]|uniref:Uncharacterized protein n=1 Tax=Meloidogyne enterolobii TaxID=390850 RepID=A0ACB0Y699_MELEN